MSEIGEKIDTFRIFIRKKEKNVKKFRLLKKICDTMRYWHVWDKAGSNVFNLKRCTLLCRPIAGKVDEIKERIEQDRHIGNHDIGKELNVDHKTVLNHLKKAGYKKKLNVRLPRDLTPNKFNESNFLVRQKLKKLGWKVSMGLRTIGLPLHGFNKNGQRWSSKTARVLFNK